MHLTLFARQKPLAASERDLIRRVAAGDKSALDAATNVYRQRYEQSSDTPELRFMFEVLQPVPDIALRSMYRKQILAK
jgi:hypothetical protein